MNDSMINPSIVDLLGKVDNRYSLVVATSRRARQIIDGVEPSVDAEGRKPLTVAIEEVNEGNINVEEGPDKILPALQEVSKVEDAIEHHVDINTEVSASMEDQADSEAHVEEGLE